MSILDTFVILFESDSAEVKKGAAEAQKTTADLEKQLSSTDSASQKLGAGFLTMTAAAGGALAAAFSFGAISAAVLRAADYADKLDEVSESLGVNIEDLDAWGNAAKMSGGSAEAFQGSMQTLTASLAQIDVTGKSKVAPFFKELGIDLDDAANKGKTAMDFLPDIAASFEGMSKQQSFGIGKKLGLDQGTIMMLQSGKAGVEALVAKQREMGVVTKEQAEISAKFNDSLDNTSHAFRGVWLGIAQSVLPALTWVMDKFSALGSFLSKHKDLVTGAFVALGAAITYFVLPPLISAGVAAAVAFAPFILMGVAIAAAAAAFALIYDDIMNFIDGNNSLIGQIIEKFPMIGTVISGIVDWFKMLFDAAVWVFETIVSLVQIAGAVWEAFSGTVSSAISSIIDNSEFLQTIIRNLSEHFQFLGDVAGAVFDSIVEKVSAVIEIVKTAIGFIKDVAGMISGKLGEVKASLGIGQTNDAVAAGQSAIASASSNPITAQTSSSIASSNQSVSKTNNVTVQKVEVQTQATDADGISKAIGGSLQTQFRQASAGYDDGVLA